MDAALQIALTALLAAGPSPAAPSRGSLLDLTPATVAVIQAQASDAARASRSNTNQVYRRRDSLVNGTLIGAAIGFAGGLIATNIECGTIKGNDECAVYTRMAFVPIGAVGGAVLGALIDRAIH